jgi:hypothetical protein
MFEYRCKLSLWVSHPNADLSDFPKRLGLRADRAHKAGDPRKTPAGALLKGVYRDSRCGITLQNESVDSLPDLLRKVLPELQRHKSVFDEYASQGALFSLFVGWFSETINSRDILDWQILADLAALKISLDLDFYGGPDEPEQNTEIEE